MPRLTNIYTRKGDEGETSLGGGQRVPKDSARVAAYGTVDELNSAIGVALAHDLSPRLMEILPVIQNELFHLGSDLAFREEDKQSHKLPHIEERHVVQLEQWIDELNEVVGPLKNFILPGGAIEAAQLHLARAICRQLRIRCRARRVAPARHRTRDRRFGDTVFESSVRSTVCHGTLRKQTAENIRAAMEFQNLNGSDNALTSLYSSH